jgi:hypothetical protein
MSSGPWPPEPFKPYEGWHWEVHPANGWRLVTGKRCRAGASPSQKACGRPSVAELDRGTWWAYCEQHLYGKWVEGGRVVGWALRPNGGETP